MRKGIATPIAAHDSIVVPADCYVQGVVTHSVRSGRVKGRAELAIRIEMLEGQLEVEKLLLTEGSRSHSLDWNATARPGAAAIKSL